MNYLQTQGIVIKETNIGESDKMLVVFSKSHGKISCLAKGARKPTSRIVGGTQFLCYSQFVLFKAKNIYLVNSCELIDCFYNIRTDIEKLTYASHIAEIVYDSVQENESFDRLLKFLLNTLHILATTDKESSLVIAIFELRVACLLGYRPQIDNCYICGNCRWNNQYFFSFNRCGIICGDCGQTRDENLISILSGTVQTLRYIITSNDMNVFSFKVSEEVLREIKYISHRYLEERLEKKYKKLDFLKSIQCKT